MKNLLFSTFLLMTTSAFGQQQITGSLYIPPLQSVTVIPTNERPIDFTSISDYASGKTISSYCKILVKSNFPWKLNASLNTGSMAGNQIPDGLVQIQVAGNQKFIPLTSKATPIIQSTNFNLTNEYYINLKVDPKLNMKTEVLLMNLSFLLSPK